ncbi:MAG: hypothetical protein ACPGSB_09785 [Opitutales bacterium]
MPPPLKQPATPAESPASEGEERFADYDEAMQEDAPIQVAEDKSAKQTRPESAGVEALAVAGPTLTLDEASARLGPEVLQALETKFNGKLCEVRVIDEKDQLF